MMGHTRPTEKNYKNFEKKLIQGLKELDINGLSLMFYGSYVRKDHTPGISDIDAVLIFPDDIIINKNNLLSMGRILNNALYDNNIMFQVSVCDMGTIRDGRFYTYTEEFKDYFNDNNETKLILGPDYRSEMKFLKFKSGPLNVSSYNLKKTRKNLLFAEYNKNNDEKMLFDNFQKALDVTEKLPRQISYLIQEELITDKDSAITSIKQNINLDILVLQEIKKLLKNPKKLDVMSQNFDDMISLWHKALNAQEMMIKDFIEKYPMNDDQNYF